MAVPSEKGAIHLETWELASIQLVGRIQPSLIHQRGAFATPVSLYVYRDIVLSNKGFATKIYTSP